MGAAATRPSAVMAEAAKPNCLLAFLERMFMGFPLDNEPAGCRISVAQQSGGEQPGEGSVDVGVLVLSAKWHEKARVDDEVLDFCDRHGDDRRTTRSRQRDEELAV